MVNYQNSKIYRIVCNTTGLTYYGSTCEKTLALRLSKHKSNFNDFLKGNFSYVTSFEILKNNNYEIFLVENYPCNSKDELHARERYYIENNECVNKFIPNRTIKEYYEANKEKYAEYREQNKEKLQEYIKQYREQNKELIKEINKQHYEENKEVIAEKRKQPYTCACGSVFRIGDKSIHFKSQKHQKYLEQNNV